MTQPSSASQYTDKHTLVLRVYFALVIIGGIITLVSLLQIPSEECGHLWAFQGTHADAWGSLDRYRVRRGGPDYIMVE